MAKRIATGRRQRNTHQRTGEKGDKYHERDKAEANPEARDVAAVRLLLPVPPRDFKEPWSSVDIQMFPLISPFRCNQKDLRKRNAPRGEVAGISKQPPIHQVQRRVMDPIPL